MYKPLGWPAVNFVSRFFKYVFSEKYWTVYASKSAILGFMHNAAHPIVNTSKLRIVTTFYLKRQVLHYWHNQSGDRWYFYFRPKFRLFRASGFYLSCRYQDESRAWICEERLSEFVRWFFVLYCSFAIIFVPAGLAITITQSDSLAFGIVLSILMSFYSLLLLVAVNLLCRYVFWKSREARKVMESVVLSALRP